MIQKIGVKVKVTEVMKIGSKKCKIELENIEKKFEINKNKLKTREEKV